MKDLDEYPFPRESTVADEALELWVPRRCVCEAGFGGGRRGELGSRVHPCSVKGVSSLLSF